MKTVFLIFMLAMSQLVYAFDGVIADNTGFATNVFNRGEEVSVIVKSHTQPALHVTGPGSDITDKMYKTGEGLYQYEFTSGSAGSYLVEIVSETNKKELILYVVR